MAIWQGFIGGAYETRSKSASAEDLINLYLETQESAGASPREVLYGTPGTAVLQTLPDGGPVRGQLYEDGRAFAVGQGNLYETTYGIPILIGPVASDVANTPCTLHANGRAGHQVFIVASGFGYILDTITGVFGLIADPQFPQGSAIRGDYVDGYFLVLSSAGGPFGGSGIQISDAPLINLPPNGLLWGSPLESTSRLIGSDALVSMIVNHREIWLFGSQTSEGWYDAGTSVSQNFPLAAIPGVFIDQGCGAPWSVSRLDNSVAWLAQNRDGDRMVMLVNQLAPQRISTFAVEESLRTCPTVSDFIGFTYQEGGHLFYILTSALNKLTWAYDPSQGPGKGWAKRSWWNPATGQHEAIRARNHVAAFGSHWVGDRASGALYRQGVDLFTDFGGPIKSVRTAPHLTNERHRDVYDLLEIDGEFGVGRQAPGIGAPPELMLDISNDGGLTYPGTQRRASLGAQGDGLARARFTRLGSSRNRVYRVSITDPVKRVFTAAYLKGRPGLH